MNRACENKEYLRAKNYSYLFKKQERLISEIIRVDHAGELGAKQIYLGQLKALPEDAEIAEMLEGELVHLDFFEDYIKKTGIRPSLLNSIWKPCSFFLGFATAKLGRGKAMLCTEKVEEVISGHYAEQISTLREGELQSKLIKFRADEMEHWNIGKEAASSGKFLGKTISFLTKLAIKISAKI